MLIVEQKKEEKGREKLTCLYKKVKIYTLTLYKIIVAKLHISKI